MPVVVLFSALLTTACGGECIERRISNASVLSVNGTNRDFDGFTQESSVLDDWHYYRSAADCVESAPPGTYSFGLRSASATTIGRPGYNLFINLVTPQMQGTTLAWDPNAGFDDQPFAVVRGEEVSGDPERLTRSVKAASLEIKSASPLIVALDAQLTPEAGSSSITGNVTILGDIQFRETGNAFLCGN